MTEKNSYDQEAEATGWFGSEILFGLSFKFVQTRQTILDLGIGTGLSAELFHKVVVWWFMVWIIHQRCLTIAGRRVSII